MKANTVSKRSKVQDQKWISLAEFKSTKGLKSWAKKAFSQFDSDILAWISDDFTTQLANRLKNTAKRSGVPVVVLLWNLLKRSSK